MVNLDSFSVKDMSSLMHNLDTTICHVSMNSDSSTYMSFQKDVTPSKNNSRDLSQIDSHHKNS